MSKTVKLLAVSLLLAGCSGMYGDGAKKTGMAKKNPQTEQLVSKHVTNHVDDVTKDIAATASATSTLAKQLPR